MHIRADVGRRPACRERNCEFTGKAADKSGTRAARLHPKFNGNIISNMTKNLLNHMEIMAA
jgi:hypothetical protein